MLLELSPCHPIGRLRLLVAFQLGSVDPTSMLMADMCYFDDVITLLYFRKATEQITMLCSGNFVLPAPLIFWKYDSHTTLAVWAGGPDGSNATLSSGAAVTGWKQWHSTVRIAACTFWCGSYADCLCLLPLVNKGGLRHRPCSAASHQQQRRKCDVGDKEAHPPHPYSVCSLI